MGWKKKQKTKTKQKKGGVQLSEIHDLYVYPVNNRLNNDMEIETKFIVPNLAAISTRIPFQKLLVFKSFEKDWKRTDYYR